MFTNEVAVAGEANSANRIDKITQEIEMDIHGIGFSLVNNAKQVDIMYIGLASSGIIWEEKRKLRIFKPLKIAEVQDMEDRYQDYLRQRAVGSETGNQFGLNDGSRVEIMPDGRLVWQRPKATTEVRRTFYPGLWVLIKTSPYQLQFHAKINRIQIDNQLIDCIFPVVLAPVPPPKSVAATTGKAYIGFGSTFCPLTPVHDQPFASRPRFMNNTWRRKRRNPKSYQNSLQKNPRPNNCAQVPFPFLIPYPTHYTSCSIVLKTTVDHLTHL